jgi:hypothetical protein
MLRQPVIAVTAALLVLSAAGCASAPAPPSAEVSAPTAAPAAAGEPVAAPTASGGAEALWEEFNPAHFTSPTTIDNQFMPLQPGTRYVYEGTAAADDGSLVSHRIEINVTDLTKVIGGIPSVVTWDLDYSEDELVEAELAFFAQDDAGNVWRMGEYPEEYEEGEFVAAPTWIHGLADARAGIAMQAEPQLGTPSYSQGWGPGVGWTDRGKVDQMGLATCVPADCYQDVLVIAETSEAEPDAFQLKFWAPKVGNVRTDWRGAGEKNQEILELVELVRLSPEELAEVRAKAFEMEQHAYEVSKDVYAQTQPMADPTTGAASAAP